MTPPKQLMEAAKEQAKHEDNGYFGFLTGVEWLFGHLCELSEREFDEESVRKYFAHYNPPSFIDRAIEGARHQHTLMIAKILSLENELEAAKQELERLNRECISTFLHEQRMAELQVEIARLEESGAGMRQRAAGLNVRDCRIKELEAALALALYYVEGDATYEGLITRIKDKFGIDCLALKGSGGEEAFSEQLAARFFEEKDDEL